MNIRKTFSLLAGLSLLAFSVAMIATAQQHVDVPSKGGKASPHQAVSYDFGGKKITITYGRPSKKGREIFGALEPYGKVWRTGADEATTIETTADLMLGSLHLEKGKYALFTLPEKDKWTLIINKTVNQWGAFKYDASQDVGRAPMTVAKASAPVEQLLISIDKKNNMEGTLKIAWDDVVASIPLMVH
jgi:hypothetical protein